MTFDWQPLSYGIDVAGMTEDRHLPAGDVTVTGSILDLTNLAGTPLTRTGISVRQRGTGDET